MPYKIIVNGNEDGTRQALTLGGGFPNTAVIFSREEKAVHRLSELDAALNPQVVPAGSEYTELAWDFLKRSGLDFRAVLVGSDCPMHCEDAQNERDMDKLDTFPRKTHIHGKHYRCTISGKDRGHVTFEFWNSYADEEFNAFKRGNVVNPDERYWDKYRDGKYRPSDFVRTSKPLKTVTPYDLLACIQKSDPYSFEDFCSDFGYDTDSRKAEATYHAVVKEWKKVQSFFTAAELTEIQEIS